MKELAISPTERHSRFHLPSSLQLLLAPGIRGHTLLFMGVLSFLFVASYFGRLLGLASTWTVVFVIGASASATYLVLAPLALSEKFRSTILFTNMKRRMIILALVFGPVVVGISYWVYQAGSVEALPVFPYFIAIFYAWILSQAYFIANPVTHAMLKFEEGVVGKGFVKRMMRTLGMTVLFLPIAPLAVGVWEISSWANQNYANVRGAGTDILLWTMVVTLMLVATYFLTVIWGWKSIKNGRPQVAIFAGGTFLVVWGYLLYRATTLLMGLVTQNEPSNAIIDAGLMVVSILGAMQTFARKTVMRASRRWSQVLPFLVFSFGSVYAVSQFYFILQGSLTRAGLSVLVNGVVFAVGTLTLMLLLRSHLKIPGSTVLGATSVPSTEELNVSAPTNEESIVSQTTETEHESRPAEASTESADDQAGSGVENMEQSDQDTRADSDFESGN
ncbi:hypothetical protein E6H21_02945 [Candidatus Bathyarchaeota archaeon]|nr:MAG: hypothetical protein E6H21_02945 [Candidatus Bathyarchaeota archaeon]